MARTSNTGHGYTLVTRIDIFHRLFPWTDLFTHIKKVSCLEHGAQAYAIKRLQSHAFLNIFFSNNYKINHYLSPFVHRSYAVRQTETIMELQSHVENSLRRNNNVRDRYKINVLQLLCGKLGTPRENDFFGNYNQDLYKLDGDYQVQL